MKNIMINCNMPVEKNAEVVKEVIAFSKVLCTTKFAWNGLRFTIEHKAINNWTMSIEHVDAFQLVYYKENISTFELAEILNRHLT